MSRIKKQRSLGGKIAVGVLFLIALGGAYYGNLFSYLNPEWVQGHLDDIKNFTQNSYWLAVALYMAAYIAGALLMLPGTSFFVMMAGLLFGPVVGTLYALCAGSVGATLSCLVARYLIGDWLQSRYRDRLSAFNQAVVQEGAFYLLVLRLMAAPFSFTNILAGCTSIHARTFFVTTFFGMIPFVITYCLIGQQLGDIGTTQLSAAPSIATLVGGFFIFRLTIVPALVRYLRPYTLSA